jgi:hypothetical protein
MSLRRRHAQEDGLARGAIAFVDGWQALFRTVSATPATLQAAMAPCVTTGSSSGTQ